MNNISFKVLVCDDVWIGLIQLVWSEYNKGMHSAYTLSPMNKFVSIEERADRISLILQWLVHTQAR